MPLYLPPRAAKEKNTEKTTDPEADFNLYLDKAALGQQVDVELREQVWTPNLYYLHTDHLGTATFVTNSSGEPTQFFLNLPFGETDGGDSPKPI